MQKFPNGYEGPYRCKGEQSNTNGQGIGDGDSTVLEAPDATIIMGDNVVILPLRDSYEVPSRDEPLQMEHIDAVLQTQPDFVATDAVGTVISEQGNSGSVVRFGESAASPTGGSQAEFHASSR